MGDKVSFPGSNTLVAIVSLSDNLNACRALLTHVITFTMGALIVGYCGVWLIGSYGTLNISVPIKRWGRIRVAIEIKL